MSKLETLLEIEGFEDEVSFVKEFAYSDCVPGICMNPDCDNTYDYEPDQNKGWCDICETKSVCSGLILIGVL